MKKLTGEKKKRLKLLGEERFLRSLKKRKDEIC